MYIEFYEWDKIKKVDDDLLEHEIINLDGIRILCPRLLASDVAHEIYIDWSNENNVPTDYVFERCRDKLEDIILEMVNHTKEILEDNDIWLA